MSPERARRLELVLAFAALYLIWGSTYLGIRIAIESVPPLLMAAGRNLAAGAILYGALRLTGTPAPPRRTWLAAGAMGAFMLLGGNGGVTWAQQRVPSGVAALMVAFMPLWMALIDGLVRGKRPGAPVLVGLTLGAAGLVVLLGPRALAGGQRVDPLGAVVLLGASLSWASGSLWSRSHRLPVAPLLGVGMQMLAGGALLAVAGVVTGELPRLHLETITGRSIAAIAYLVVFGSLVGYTAYIWLLGATTPAKASTYAFVNPIVAVVLGWAFAGEPLTARVLIAAAVIVAGVALITSSPPRATVRDPAILRPATSGGSPGR